MRMSRLAASISVTEFATAKSDSLSLCASSALPGQHRFSEIFTQGPKSQRVRFPVSFLDGASA
jgi:hypothetical protein